MYMKDIVELINKNNSVCHYKFELQDSSHLLQSHFNKTTRFKSNRIFRSTYLSKSDNMLEIGLIIC